MKAKPVDASLPQLVNLKASAREIGVPYGTWRDEVLRSGLPTLRMGRAIYLDRADIVRHIESRKEIAA